MKKIICVAVVVLLLIVSISGCGAKEKECNNCKGSGTEKCLVLIGAEVLGASHGYDCTRCNGTGKHICYECNGTGISPEK